MLNPEKEIERLILHVLSTLWTEQDGDALPYVGKVFAVGGYIRDELLGIKSKDLDITVELKGGAKAFTEYLHGLFPSAASRPLQLGAGYPIWHLSFKDDIEFMGERFGTYGAEVDFADTQRESFPDPTTRQRITEFGTIQEDCERRDFTTNMLLRDLSTGALVDICGTSVQDIHLGILRGHPKVSLNKTFSDDPLRMIRLIRFHCKFGWKIPLSVLKLVKENSFRIEIVSGERIREELVKIMGYGKLARAIRMMHTVGLLQYVFPEVIDDTFTSTLEVTQRAKPTVIDQLSAFLQYTGGSQAEKIMRRLHFDLDTIFVVKKTVQSLGVIVEKIRPFIRESGDELDPILNLMEANEYQDIQELRELISNANKIPVSKFTILSGDEIKEALSIEEGPKVGKAIKLLREIEDDYAVMMGKAITKELAWAMLRADWNVSHQAIIP